MVHQIWSKAKVNFIGIVSNDFQSQTKELCIVNSEPRSDKNSWIFWPVPSKFMKRHISKTYAYRTRTEKNPRPFLVAPTWQLVPPPPPPIVPSQAYISYTERRKTKRERVGWLPFCSSVGWGKEYGNHRLDMELDLQSLFGLLRTDSLAEATQLPPPAFRFDSYTRALLVSHDRRHLFVTPWQ